MHEAMQMHAYMHIQMHVNIVRKTADLCSLSRNDARFPHTYTTQIFITAEGGVALFFF